MPTPVQPAESESAGRYRKVIIRIERKLGIVCACEALLWEVCAANVAAVTAAVGGSVLPLVNDQTLTAGRVVEEESGNEAIANVVAWCEVSVDESSCIAIRVCIGGGVAIWTVRSLHFSCGHRNNEVAVQIACNAIVHCALSNRRVLTTSWTRVGRIGGTGCTGRG